MTTTGENSGSNGSKQQLWEQNKTGQRLGPTAAPPTVDEAGWLVLNSTVLLVRAVRIAGRQSVGNQQMLLWFQIQCSLHRRSWSNFGCKRSRSSSMSLQNDLLVPLTLPSDAAAALYCIPMGATEWLRKYRSSTLLQCDSEVVAPL